MRTFVLATSLAVAIVCVLASTGSAAAQVPPDSAEDTRGELSSAGIPLLNSPPASQTPPAQPGPGGQPQAIPVDLPIPDPTDWIPNPTDWIPGGLNPLNWAGDIVNAVFTIVGKALLEAMRGFVDWALGLIAQLPT